MEQTEILERVDKKKLQHWLSSVRVPLLRTTRFFEQMGFPAWFVRQYLRKHRYVLQSGGTIQQKVRGINELDFLYGLADAIGIDTSEMTIRNSRKRRAADVAKECLRILDEVDDDNEPEKAVVSAEVSRSGKSNVYSSEMRGHKYITIKG